MALRHVKTVINPQTCQAKILAIDWAPSNTKFAVCTSDRIVALFNDSGERKERFATKPADSKAGKKSYMVTGLAFSGDSHKLAIAQSDSMVFVYKFGDNWDDKKVISNKFAQPNPVTCIIWPAGQPLIIGLADGKVRAADPKTNKSSLIYNAESFTVALATSPNGLGFISGHADGKIIRYFFDDEGSGDKRGTIAIHSTAPYALAWCCNTVLAAGSDQRICVYARDGRLMQQFDYSKDEHEKEFTLARVNPAGNLVAFGSYDRIRLLNWSARKLKWEEGPIKEIKNLYTITALAWSRDGLKLILGTLTGAVEMLEFCLKKKVYKDHFEINFVSPNQGVLEDLVTGERMQIKSSSGYEIDSISIMGNEQFLVVPTSNSLLICDLKSHLSSEVNWTSQSPEMFYFGEPGICMVFEKGRLSIIEIGKNEIMWSVRTEHCTPYLISTHLKSSLRVLAYAIDPRTVGVWDLTHNRMLHEYTHSREIDWLSLNSTGNKLIFRDKKVTAYLLDVQNGDAVKLVSQCSHIQWVPQADVIVAQSSGTIFIWYSTQSTAEPTRIPARGMQLIGADQTNLILSDGVTNTFLPLDKRMIELNISLDSLTTDQVSLLVRELEEQSSTAVAGDSVFLEKVCSAALEQGNAALAQFASAKLGDYSKALFLQKCKRGDARILFLNEDFDAAESRLLQLNNIEEVIDINRSLYKWKEAIEIARSYHSTRADQLEEEYRKWLRVTGQDDVLAELALEQGNSQQAINLYLNAQMPGKASLILLSGEDDLAKKDPEMVEKVTKSLVMHEMFERAAELQLSTGKQRVALNFYKQGRLYQKAIELAREVDPGQVVALEIEWAEHLVTLGQTEQAFSHFIESGQYRKAAEAAVQGKHWNRLAELLESTNPTGFEPFYIQLGQEQALQQDYKAAERSFLNAGDPKAALHMYNQARMWTHRDYSDQVKILEEEGKFAEAESLYLSLNEPEKAIEMYLTRGMHQDVIRLVKKHCPQNLSRVYTELAEICETDHNWKQAEHFYSQNNDWKSIINMYSQVAYLWARNLGGDSAIRLLKKLQLVDSSIDYAVEQMAFDFALELANSAAPGRVSDIYLKQAICLEDEGKLPDAEAAFLRAGKSREAVLMYVHCHDWDSAYRVAQQHDPETVNEIFLGLARVAFADQDFEKAETFLLRAERADIAVKAYKEVGLWEDALRVAATYMPNKYKELEEEYMREQAMGSIASKAPIVGVDLGERRGGLMKAGSSTKAETEISALEEAAILEQEGKILEAIELYLNFVPPNNDKTALAAASRGWLHANELTLRFLDQEQATKISQIVVRRLTTHGCHKQAADLLLSVGNFKEAVEEYMKAGAWDKARSIARDVDPALEQLVESRTRSSHGDVNQALEVFAREGKWDRCLTIAEQLIRDKGNSIESQTLLHKYVAKYAASLIKDDRVWDALQLYNKYGTPAFQQNFNIYKHIFQGVTSQRGLDKANGYTTWSALRNMLASLLDALRDPSGLPGHGDASGHSSKSNISPEIVALFERMFLVSHYYAVRSALMSIAESNPNVQEMAARISIALLRHCDILPVDKAFFEAGTAARQQEWNGMAFVFLNRYLDLIEAIEDPEENAENFDDTEFASTDIPTKVPLPSSFHTTKEEHEEARNWILSVSMSKKLERKLPVDSRGVFLASLHSSNENLSTSQTDACILTGYPIISGQTNFVTFGEQATRKAVKEDWSLFQLNTKSTRNSNCIDVYDFICRHFGPANS
ncbi:hypothetical protein Ciccas_003697 [Cichlidogyrus casuarinus]|uniref:IFT80 second beta-propeller domain-containing protein n=1 Tax=Cichlidogyrus casuarinus TaxID=1844966 RepID=A0ABD2QEI2_9PLAT